ncbi:MAG: CinA family protein [Rhodoferax sp.]
MPQPDDTVHALAQALRARGWWLATAESCTGGLVAARCTDLSGSSQWFERGFVTYSNAAKTEALGVDATLLQAHGAVSEAVARAMAEGARCNARVEVALSTTGVAGPDGGSPTKPVGTVWMAWALPGATHAALHHFAGDRAQVRQAAVQTALRTLLDLLEPPIATK